MQCFESRNQAILCSQENNCKTIGKWPIIGPLLLNLEVYTGPPPHKGPQTCTESIVFLFIVVWINMKALTIVIQQHEAANWHNRTLEMTDKKIRQIRRGKISIVR